MSKAGEGSDCVASRDCSESVELLPEQDVGRMPKPGEVDFLSGGPPCQGFSGLNRHGNRLPAALKNSMVMNFLSYADFYRPTYMLMENVRSLVTHNKGATFGLIIRTLLEMGYQVRSACLWQSRGVQGHGLMVWSVPQQHATYTMACMARVCLHECLCTSRRGLLC